MKRTKIFALAVLCFLSAGSLFAAEEKIEYKPYFYDKVIREIDKPQAPVVTDDYIVFTAESGHRFVGVAFDFENYQIIHPFQVLHTFDIDGAQTNEVLFYCYERKHKISEIKYRLVIDGLWTVDPYNPVKEYDTDVNLYFSKVISDGNIEIATEKTKSDTVHFIYKGEAGLDLRLAGTFTSWDPWIYAMEETEPGFYELELALPKGKYYYNYYVGMTPLLDPTNPNKAYTREGRNASVLTIE